MVYISNLNNFYWCTMPLDSEIMKKIPFSHQIRPYYFFDLDKDADVYFAFPCTSKSPSPLAFETDYVIYKNTTINLKECHIINGDKFKNSNCFWDLGKLNENQYDNLVKKLKTNYFFENYPDKVKYTINSYMKTCTFTICDVLYNENTNEYIIAKPHNESYECVKLSFIPTFGYVETSIDGYKCFIDLYNPFFMKNISGYKLKTVSSSYNKILNSKNQINIYNNKTLDITKPDLLPFGTVLRVIKDGKEYIFIKINNTHKGVCYLIGKKDMLQKDYIFYNIPFSENFEYEFLHINNENKMKYILSKHKK